MSDWALITAGQYAENQGADATNSRGKDLASNASANVEGTWTTIGSTFAEDCDGFWLSTLARGGAVFDAHVDLSIDDGGGNKKIILTDWLVSNGGIAFRDPAIYLPIPVRAGEQVYGRAQSGATGGQNIDVDLLGVAHGFIFPGSHGRITTYGADETDSGGTSVDPGGTVNTKGSWAQLTASTDNDISWLMIAIGNARLSRTGAVHGLLDVGIGAGGSEKIILPDLPHRTGTTSDMNKPGPSLFGPFAVEIPAGTRLAARRQADSNNATDRLVDIVLYGID